MSKRDEFGLTPKQRLFADEYIANKGNAYQAALKAGYKEKYAKNAYSKLVEKGGISEYIKSRTEPILEELKLNGDDVLREIARIGFGEIQEGYSKKTNMLTKEVESEMKYEHTADTENRLRALELLGKYLKLFTDKVEAEVTGTVNFINDVPLDDD